MYFHIQKIFIMQKIKEYLVIGCTSINYNLKKNLYTTGGCIEFDTKCKSYNLKNVSEQNFSK